MKLFVIKILLFLFLFIFPPLTYTTTNQTTRTNRRIIKHKSIISSCISNVTIIIHIELKETGHRIININSLSGLMYNKIAKDPRITVSLKSDEKTTMKLITDIHSQLRKANALKLSYSALTKTHQ